MGDSYVVKVVEQLVWDGSNGNYKPKDEYRPKGNGMVLLSTAKYIERPSTCDRYNLDHKTAPEIDGLAVVHGLPDHGCNGKVIKVTNYDSGKFTGYLDLIPDGGEQELMSFD